MDYLKRRYTFLNIEFSFHESLVQTVPVQMDITKVLLSLELKGNQYLKKKHIIAKIYLHQFLEKINPFLR